MKYYIDFEASDAEEIISVGCVDENGREFYSLVHSDDLISADIQKLTGLSQEMVSAAPLADEVFESFYDWCNASEEMPDFICYGDSDHSFVNNTFFLCNSLKAASILSYIYMNMEDCSEEIRNFFYVNKTISLQKLALHFDENIPEQNHNALDDAKLLKMVYEGIGHDERRIDSFNEYLNPYKIPGQITKILRINNGVIEEEYADMAAVRVWMIAQNSDKNPSYLNNFEDKIRKAVKEGSRYFGFHWRIL